MTDSRTLIPAAEIAEMAGLEKTHFLNPRARRVNKSLGDLCGLTGIGVHIIEVAPGDLTTEYHRHYFEDECVYVLAGEGTARIGDARHAIAPGDFIGYAAGGAAHDIENTGADTLRLLVIGQRLDHDVGDYPEKGKRIFRDKGLPWAVAALDDLDFPQAGAKK